MAFLRKNPPSDANAAKYIQRVKLQIQVDGLEDKFAEQAFLAEQKQLRAERDRELAEPVTLVAPSTPKKREPLALTSSDLEKQWYDTGNFLVFSHPYVRIEFINKKTGERKVINNEIPFEAPPKQIIVMAHDRIAILYCWNKDKFFFSQSIIYNLAEKRIDAIFPEQPWKYKEAPHLYGTQTPSDMRYWTDGNEEYLTFAHCYQLTIREQASSDPDSKVELVEQVRKEVCFFNATTREDARGVVCDSRFYPADFPKKGQIPYTTQLLSSDHLFTTGLYGHLLIKKFSIARPSRGRPFITFCDIQETVQWPKEKSTYQREFIINQAGEIALLILHKKAKIYFYRPVRRQEKVMEFEPVFKALSDTTIPPWLTKISKALPGFSEHADTHKTICHWAFARNLDYLFFYIKKTQQLVYIDCMTYQLHAAMTLKKPLQQLCTTTDGELTLIYADGEIEFSNAIAEQNKKHSTALFFQLLPDSAKLPFTLCRLVLDFVCDELQPTRKQAVDLPPYLSSNLKREFTALEQTLKLKIVTQDCKKSSSTHHTLLRLSDALCASTTPSFAAVCDSFEPEVFKEKSLDQLRQLLIKSDTPEFWAKKPARLMQTPELFVLPKEEESNASSAPARDGRLLGQS